MEEYNFIIRVGENCTIRAFLQLPEGTGKNTEDIAYDIWKMWGQSAGYGLKGRSRKTPHKPKQPSAIDRLFRLG